jgi:hypothetical protein
MLTARPLSVPAILEAWSLELQAGLWRGEPPALLERLNEDMLAPDEPEAEALIASALAEDGPLQARLREAERGWVGPTDCDRLDVALAALEALGIGGHIGGLSLHDAHAWAAQRWPSGAAGLCLLHQGDVLDAIAGEGLLLAFDTAGDGPGAPAARAAVGRAVVAALRGAGLPATWTGDPDDRVLIRPFVYQRRRWTLAPALDGRGLAPWAPGPRAAPRGGPDAAALEPYLQPVVARRTLDAVDPELRLLLRGLWRHLGGAWGQLAHAGAPHIFTPAGAEALITVRDALANLDPAEAAALRAEARRRARPAQPVGPVPPAPAAGAGPALRRLRVGAALAATLGPLLAFGLAAALPPAQAGLSGGALSGLLLVGPVAGPGGRGRAQIAAAVLVGGLVGAVVGAVVGGLAGARWLG